MTTKTTTTPSGKTITVEIERRVQDKVNYSDGYNIVVGREIIDRTNITMRDATGKVIATGHGLSSVSPRFDAKGIAGGAVAKMDNAYVRQDLYDIITALIAEVNVETPKSDEQVEIETAKANAEKAHDVWYNSADQITARKFEREMNRPDSDY